MLPCGKHECSDFCHLGFCKPCKWVSNQPLFCPCGIAKLDPPIKCGIPNPSCGGPCQQKLQCGHPCHLNCHNGICPPCLEIVNRLCNCGKELITNIQCKNAHPSCGKECKQPLNCGHLCQKVCHLPGKCFSNQDELMEKGCGQRCGKERSTCSHRCMDKCHPNQPCPDKPCEAEIRLYCKCGNRWVQTLCKSSIDKPVIDCDARCWKKQRDDKIANAFSSSAEFHKNKDSINFEYYPEEALQFAQENLAWVKKVET